MRHRFPGGAEPPRPAVPLPIDAHVHLGARRRGRADAPDARRRGERDALSAAPARREEPISIAERRRRADVGGTLPSGVRAMGPRRPPRAGQDASASPQPRSSAGAPRRLGGDGPPCRRGALRLRPSDAQPRSSHLRGSPPVSGQGEFGSAMGRSGGRGRGGRSEPRGDGVGCGRSATRAKDGPAPDGSAPSPEDARPATQAAAPASAPGPQPAGEARRASLASLQCLSRAKRAEERFDDAASDAKGSAGERCVHARDDGRPGRGAGSDRGAGAIRDGGAGRVGRAHGRVRSRAEELRRRDAGGEGARPRDRQGRVPDDAGALGLWQDHLPDDAGGLRGRHPWRDPPRRSAHRLGAAPQARHRHGVPELRALPAHERGREPLLPARGARDGPRGARGQGRARARHGCA